ncbi:MAG: inositol monophosphatase, partial [Deltaproteobacteria bacterium]|nr:inositol monophosphatase [Deltaproteobacteria bacterium]
SGTTLGSPGSGTTLGSPGSGTTLGSPGSGVAERALERAVLVTGYSYSERSAQARATMRVVSRVLARVRAVRRVGAAALDLANVAAGRFDGFWEAGLNPWDVAAGILLVQEAGGRVSNGDGRPYRYGDPLVVATNGPLQRPLLGLLRDPRARM